MPTETPKQVTSASSNTDGNTIKNIYILFYRHGMNPQCQKGFICSGDIKAAVQRAQRHCEIMNYRYIFVRPLVSDIEEEEKYKLEHN